MKEVIAPASPSEQGLRDSMNQTDRYRVIVFGRPDDPQELRELLAEQLGLNSVDAGIAVRHAPGVLPQKLDQETANQTAREITRRGLQAIAVPESDLLDPHQARTVHHVRCTKEGFQVIDPAGARTETLAWDQLKLVCVGRVPLEKTHYYLVGNVFHAGPVPPSDHQLLGTMHGCEAWLVFEKPRQLIHIDSNHMNYEYLGERKTTSGTTNFEQLLTDIVQHAPQAYLTPSTRACLEHAGLEKYDFDSSEQLQQLLVLQDQLARHVQNQGDAAS